VIKVFDAATGRPLRRFLAFNRRFRNGVALTAAVNPDGNGFSVTAQTSRRGRTYTRVFDGLTGVPLGPLGVSRRS
jgi:hypothetical protein